jgi:hypothetical protein
MQKTRDYKLSWQEKDKIESENRLKLSELLVDRLENISREKRNFTKA